MIQIYAVNANNNREGNMGFLKNLFGKTTKIANNSKSENFDSPTSVLLKEATQRKKSDDLAGAIACLKSAYKIMCEKPEWFSAESACRLPMYLCENKQVQEGWDTFIDICKRSDRYSISVVYNKMRLFLQRTGKPLNAVKYGIFSCLAEMVNGYLNNEVAKKNGGCQVQIISTMSEDEIEKLLKKAKRAEITSNVKNIVDKYFDQIPKVDFTELGKELDSLFSKKQ